MAGVAGGDVLRGAGHRVCRGGPRPGQGAASSAAPSQETVLRGGARGGGGAVTAGGGAAAVTLRPQLAHQDPVLRPARPRCVHGAHHRAAAQSERRARVSSGRVGRGRAGPGGGARVRRGGPGQGAAGAVPPRLQHAGTAAHHKHFGVGHH